MGAFEEFMSSAGRGLQSLRDAYSLVQHARGKTHEALASLRAATEGTGNTAVDASIARLEAVADALGQAAGHGVAGAETFKDYLVQIGAEAATGSMGTSAGLANEPTREAAQARRLEGFKPGAIHPAGVADIKNRVGYPRNAEGRTSARGVLYDAAGTEIAPEPYKPYRKGEQPYRPELTPGFNDPEQTTTAWHSEADIAQAIRDGDLDRSTVYMNVPLCGKNTRSAYPDPKGCYENYRHTIPEGTTAYVVVVPEKGAPYRMKMIGTGKALHG